MYKTDAAMKVSAY